MGRPLFVLGILPFYALGLSLAWAQTRQVDWGLAIAGLATVLAVQLMTHYANEFWDMEADRANATPTRFSGGSRALVSGAVRPRMALVGAGIAFTASALLAGYLLSVRGGLALALWALAAFIGWFYSAPPLRLEARGLGEALIAITSAFLVPLMAYYLQQPSLSPVLVVLALPLGLLVFAMTLATELPDLASDISAGKATLPARWGRRGAARLHDAALVLAYAIVPLEMLWGTAPSGWWLFGLTLPLGAICVAFPKTTSGTAGLERLCLMDALLVGLGPLALIGGLLLSAA